MLVPSFDLGTAVQHHAGHADAALEAACHRTGARADGPQRITAGRGYVIRAGFRLGAGYRRVVGGLAELRAGAAGGVAAATASGRESERAAATEDDRVHPFG